MRVIVGLFMGCVFRNCVKLDSRGGGGGGDKIKPKTINVG